MVRIVSLTVLTALIVFLGITFYQVIAPFLLPLFLAGVLAIISQPVFYFFFKKTKGRTRVAAGLTTVAVLAMLLAPILLGTMIATTQLSDLVHEKIDSGEWKETVGTLREQLQLDHLAKRLLPFVPQRYRQVQVESEAEIAPEQPGDDSSIQRLAPPDERPKEEPRQTTGQESTAPDADAGGDGGQGSESAEEKSTRLAAEKGEAIERAEIDQLQAKLEANIKLAMQSITRRTMGAAGVAAAAVPGAAFDIIGLFVSGLVGTLMFIIALYYFLADGPALLIASERLVPVHVDYQRELRKRFELVVRAVVLATFLTALLQGFLTATAISLAGYGQLFVLLFILSTLASLIPLAGTWLIWGPFAIWMAMNDQVGAAILLALFGAGVIGTMDNVIRTYVLQSDAKLHPLLAFISVLGGLQVMGLWGVFIGPIVASCLHALVQIFNTELKEFSKEKFAGLGAEMTESSAAASAASEPKIKQAVAAHTPDKPSAADVKEASSTKDKKQKSRRGGKKSRKRR